MLDAERLARAMAPHVAADGVHATAIPRLSLIRSSRPTEPLHALHEPALCIVAQGRKQVMLADRLFAYDPANFLIVSVDVPVTGQVVEARPDAPYLCLRLDLDPAMLSSLTLESAAALSPDDGDACGLRLCRVTPELIDAATRLVALLDRPADIPVLAPLAEREILYRLLVGPQGGVIRRIAAGDGRLQRVARAIHWLKRNYAEPFAIEAVAGEARMSPSALHQHFKAVTAMSPLQYQKQLRLQEARRLMIGRSLDAASAGFEVGYGSPSQFSREYSRLYGAPPAQDVARLRASQGA